MLPALELPKNDWQELSVRLSDIVSCLSHSGAVDSSQDVKLSLIFAWCCAQLFDRHGDAGGQCRDFADGATDRGGDESRLSCQVPGVSLSSSLVLLFPCVYNSYSSQAQTSSGECSA